MTDAGLGSDFSCLLSGDELPREAIKPGNETDGVISPESLAVARRVFSRRILIRLFVL